MAYNMEWYEVLFVTPLELIHAWQYNDVLLSLKHLLQHV